MDAYVQERYVEAIQQKGETNQLVCTEYLITNPLLFVTILCGAASTIPTALVQLAFATMLLFHILCMGTLMVSRLARDKSLETNLCYIAKQAVIILSIACILSLVASLCIFVTYTSREDHPFSADRSMAVAVWVLIVVQCVFAIVIVFSAVGSAYDLFGMDGAHGQSTRTLFVLMYIMVAFVMRITIASIILDSFTGGRLPLCSMWMEGQ